MRTCGPVSRIRHVDGKGAVAESLTARSSCRVPGAGGRGMQPGPSQRLVASLGNGVRTPRRVLEWSAGPKEAWG